MIKKRVIVKTLIGAAFMLLFLVLIVLLKTVDVAAIGPLDEKVGLSGINGRVYRQLGMNRAMYDVTEKLTVAAFISPAAFFVVALCQLIGKKSINKVDRDIIVFGMFMFVLLAIYMLFDSVLSVNSRPVLLDSGLEPSFPSSHTLLFGFIGPATVILLAKRIKNKPALIAAGVAIYAVTAFVIIGRLIAGVHWFTDIVGGILLSASLVFLFSAACDGFAAPVAEENNRKERN